MTTNEIRQAYLDFFTDKIRQHKKIPPAPLVPPDDSTTLFTGSGMQQLVPYLKGEPHPMGKRLVDSQPCFRAEDIEEVGDNRHTTFFEMLGNWGLGDYFKKDQLTWIWEFLTKKLKLPKNKLHVTIFDGDKNLKRKTRVSQSLTPDVESKSILVKLGIPESHIHWCGSKKNWWSRAGTPNQMPPGIIGGTTSEVFFEFDQIKHNSKFGKTCHPNCECGKFIEIGNSVFMEYKKQKDGSLKPLPKQNVDFGGGLERLAQAVQNQSDIFQIDIFKPLIKTIETATNKKYQDNNQVSMRVIADHLRAAKAMIDSDIEPSNKQQGYILRRLIRRSLVKFRQLTKEPKLDSFNKIIDHPVIIEEIKKFQQSLERGLREFEKFDDNQFNSLNAFNLFQTYGFPYEVTAELFKQKGHSLNKKEFDKVFEDHKKLSRTASTGMFKGGLEDQSEATKKLHTATHLLHQSLRKILGDHVRQQGSHITAERLRFDFTHDQTLTDDQLKKIENLINQQIKKDLSIKKAIQTKDQALKSGALAFFKESYPDKVTVYSIGDFSKELCGGPHVSSTGEIGSVKIIKQESIGAGKRRLYAVLKNENQKPAYQTQS